MSFLDRFFGGKLATTEDLHAVIHEAGRRLDGHAPGAAPDPRADAEVTAMEEAMGYATVSLVHGITPDTLLRDPYIARAVSACANGRGFEDIPNPARAVLVMSNDLGTGAVFEDAGVDRRRWSYASDCSDLEPVSNRCHRCTPPWETSGPPTAPVVGVVRISRGRYVVQFDLCAGCMALFDGAPSS